MGCPSGSLIGVLRYQGYYDPDNMYNKGSKIVSQFNKKCPLRIYDISFKQKRIYDIQFNKNKKCMSRTSKLGSLHDQLGARSLLEERNLAFHHS
jgi:hypothetical protein